MIGVFDSGLGGLSILKYFLKSLPDYNYIYFGDNARAPYGSRSEDTIYNYAKEAMDFLFSKKCKIVIIACNTASAVALRKLQQEYLPKNYPKKRILGIIRPLAEYAISDKSIKKLGIIGTKATINSKVYEKEILKLNSKIKIIRQKAPLLVPLIEEGWIKKPETKMILKKYLRKLKMKQVDGLILACTHYSFLLKYIQNIMHRKCKIFNNGEIIAESFKKYINKHTELKIKKSKNPSCEFFITDSVAEFKEIGEKFLEEKIKMINKIKL